MKKVFAILLAIIMVCSIVACKADKAQTENEIPESSSSPVSSDPDSADSESSAPNNEDNDADSSASTVGYITDDVDHYSRDTYQIAYLYYKAEVLEKAHFSAMQDMQERLNIEVTDFSANEDADMFITNIEVCGQGDYDGFVVEPYPDAYERIYEVLMETELPFIYTVNSYHDENGSNLVPVVVLDQYKNGQTQMQWLYEHYKDYWSEDIDTSEIALMTLEFSVSPDLVERIQGVKDKFAEYFPNNEIIVGDIVSRGYGTQHAYDESAAILAANSDIKYWWISGATEDLSQGAARAVEASAKEDSSLIVSSGANVLPVEWDAGYRGCWVASYAVFNYNYIVPALCGLIAMIDGRATPETLWAEVRKEGDIATAYIAGDRMITADIYKTVQEDIAREYGIIQ